MIYRQEKWWAKINWAAMERSVRQVQSRIFKASREGSVKRAKHLMKLLARSETARLLAIHAVTQRNDGRDTPGIDGKVYLKDEDRMALAKEEFNYRSWRFQPALRRYIPKSKDPRAPKGEPLKLRPLSIMTIKDRVMATVVSYAMNAQWEALLEPNVFGFRPGRCTQDAIQVIHAKLSHQDMVILDADIKSFFDMVRHDVILSSAACFKAFIKHNLVAGIVENGRIKRPATGIMQGSPLSPVMANMALHGLETLLEQERDVFVIRYADDLVAFAPTMHVMKSRVLPRISAFLAERGLELKVEKTRLVTRREGFNFLGFTIEKPRQKLFLRPQREKVQRFLEHVRAIIKSNKQVAQRTLIADLNLAINGWASYYRYSDAYVAFTRVDDALWRALWRWARRRHPNKGRHWVANRYFGVSGNRTWLFRDEKTGYALVAARNTKREKYEFVVGSLSPLDKSPTAVEAWKRRRFKELLHVVEYGANGTAGLPDGCYLPLGG